jgi:hypothetical protein
MFASQSNNAFQLRFALRLTANLTESMWVMEKYHQKFFHYQMDDWVQWVSSAECTAHNHISDTTNSSVYFGTYEFHPQMTFGHYPFTDSNDICKVNTWLMAQWMEQLFSELRAEMKRLQAVLSEQTNKS